MTIGWRKDKAWSDRFIPEIKSILGKYLIQEATEEEDQKRNTDLMVLSVKPMRIGCRIRKYSQIRYADEFTIRAGRPSGMQTELAKIVEGGWGDYFFYGFASEDQTMLKAWIVGELDSYRAWCTATGRKTES